MARRLQLRIKPQFLLTLLQHWLKYLLDASRRIDLKNFGEEKLLISKSKNKSPLVEQVFVYKNKIAFQHPEAEFIELAEPYLSKENTSLNLGIGAFKGYLVQNGSRVLTAAPLAIVKTEVFKNTDTQEYELDIQRDSIRLNLDLLSLFFAKNSAYEDDEFNPERSRELKAAAEAEQQLALISADIESDDTLWLSKAEDLCFEIIARFKDRFAQLRSLHISEEVFVWRHHFNLQNQQVNRKSEGVIEASLFEQSANYHKAVFRMLSGESEAQATVNTLRKIVAEPDALSGTNISLLAEQEIPQLSSNLHFNPFVLNYLLPFEPDAEQRLALEKVLSEALHYVQGPPGTGKTKLAELLIWYCLATGKRVLMSGSKWPTLEVLQERIQGFIGQRNFYTFLLHSPENQQSLLSAIEQWLMHSQATENEIYRLKISAAFTVRKVVKSRNSIEEIRRLLSNDDKNKELTTYYEQELSKLIHYQTDKSKEAVLSSAENKEKIERILSYCSTKQNHLSRLLLNKMIALFSTAFKAEFSGNYQTNLQLCKDLFRYVDFQTHAQKIELLSDQELQELQQEQKRLKQENLNCIRDYYLKLSEIKKAQVNRSDLELYAKIIRTKQPYIKNKLWQQIELSSWLNSFAAQGVLLRQQSKHLPDLSNLFDYAIIDEAGQANLPESIALLWRSHCAAIIGDHKQLGLAATGLNFQLSASYDELAWARLMPGNIGYREGISRGLSVQQNSVLDLVGSAGYFNRKTMLLNHYRSQPELARKTSESYYEGQLKIKTVPKSEEHPSIQTIEIEGFKDPNTGICKAEAETVIQYLKELQESGYSHSLGVVSPFRAQADHLSKIIQKHIDEAFISRTKLDCGTVEDWQGDERHSLIISFAIDPDNTQGIRFLESAARFNVLTSRAKERYLCFINRRYPREGVLGRWLEG